MRHRIPAPRTFRRAETSPVRIVPQRTAHLRALVVGGVGDQGRMTARMLAHVGLRTVSEYGLSGSATDKILSFRPDVVFLDFSASPGEAALLTLRIRKRDFPLRNVPVIAMVPHLTATAAKALLSTGVSDMIMRPLSPAMLYARLVKILNVPRHAAEPPKREMPRPRTLHDHRPPAGGTPEQTPAMAD